MAYSLDQSLQIQQNLSPQMLQSLALLPLPIQDLQTYIKNEIESNPALEIPESDIMEEYHDDKLLTEHSDEDASDRKESFLENIPNKNESLTEHLLRQLGVIHTDSVTNEISQLLIGNLDANGFFIVPLSTLFENKKYSEDQINQALSLVRSFEPYGVCVSDFRESLILQAKCSGMNSSDIEIFALLVNNHLEDIKNSKLSETARALRISQEDLETFIDILKSFTPYPGRAYSDTGTLYAIPEFSIHNVDGKLVLNISNANLPSLVISSDFETLAKQTQSKEENDYINTCLKQAKNLIMQVQMRYQTLSKTALALMELQEDFFFNGSRFLKTLTLKEVAEKVGVHETTISRLSQNKYVETDFGLFPLKYFFSQGVITNSGQTISRNAIKDMIAEFKRNNPKLSAQKISDMLSQRGISCARRTVAKYLSEIE